MIDIDFLIFATFLPWGNKKDVNNNTKKTHVFSVRATMLEKELFR